MGRDGEAMRRALGLLVAGVAVAAGCGGEDDPLAELRAADGVREVRDDAGADGLVVTVEPRTGPATIAAAVEAVPREVRRATFRDGRAELVVSGAGARGQTRSAAAALAALSGVRSPARRIVVEAAGGAPRVRAEVDRPAQAAPLAREVVAQAGPERLRGDAVRDVVVQQAGSEARGAFTVVLQLSGTPADAPKLAALDAVEALAAREPRLTAVGPNVDLRVTAEDVDDAGAAWAQAAGALDLEAAGRGDVDLSVAVGDAPVLGGPADTSPRRALALLRAFGDRVVAPYARTDLSSAQARMAQPRTIRATVADATRAARAARGAGVERLTVEWPAGDDVEWLGAVPEIDATSASVADTPAGVLRVLPAVRRAHVARFPAIRWSRPAPGRLARLALGRPELVDELEDEESGSESALGGRARSRRLARTIRAIGWPGTARFELPVGKGTCQGGSASTVAEVVSTAAGRAKSVDARYGCADEELVRAFGDTWDDTASR